jgi:hypothetical protein
MSSAYDVVRCCTCRWRELAAQLTHEERDPLYNEWNALWQQNVELVSAHS